MPIIDHARLRDIVREIVARAGSLGDEPALVADHLVDANLAGHDSHGVGLLTRYMENLYKVLLKSNQHAELVTDHGALIVIDGNQGYGQVVAREAMEIAIGRAKTHGLALLALRNAHHIGRVGAWGLMAAEAGLVSTHYVNVIGHEPLVAPFRGSDARFATNPYCCALPATENRPPMLLDMATSKVALGKVRVALNKGEEVAPENLIDDKGRPTTDPEVMYREPMGALLPFGLHKGYGLALVCELLAGALTGGGTGKPGFPRDGRIINNMLAILIDPSHLVEREAFAAEVEAMLDYVTASPAADPDAPVLVPGDPERATRAERMANGVPVDDTTWEQILSAAEKLGLSRAAAKKMAA